MRMTKDQYRLMLQYAALSRGYNGLIEELNSAVLKKELSEAEHTRLAAVRVRLSIVGEQVKAVLLSLQDMGFLGSVAWQPENVLPTLCSPDTIQRN